MKLGLIVRANDRGLGIQSWEAYNHLNPHKTLCVILAGDDPALAARYPDAMLANGVVKDQDFVTVFHDCDVVLSFETFYNSRAVQQAKQLKKPPAFVLQPNYEQQGQIELADGLIVPSVWYFNDWKHAKKTYLPVPINRERLKYDQRTTAKVFVHNGGTQLGDDRNGTLVLLEAMRFVKSPLQLIVRLQKTEQLMYNKCKELAAVDPRITLDTSTFNSYWELWREGDVFVYPRAYGGLSLPVNEAMSVGMPVIMPDLNPQNEFLPKALLVPPASVRTVQMHRPIQACTVDPRTLAQVIDGFYGKDISALSAKMDEVAGWWAWDKLKVKYLNTLKQYAN